MKYREPQTRRIFQENLQFKAIDIIKIFPGIDAQQQESTPHIDWFPWHTKYQILNTKNTAEQQQSSPKVYSDTITISLQVQVLVPVADTMSRLLLIFKY